MTTPATAAPGISAAIVGTAAGPLVHTLDARWVMAYAAALGERDGRYFDTTRPAGPLPHPLFPVCYEWPAVLAVRAQSLDEALWPLGVHATHHLVIHRPPRAGETLSTTARVLGVSRRRSGALVTLRVDTVGAAGEPVTTTDYGSVYRGVEALGGATREAAPPLDAPVGAVRWSEPVALSQHAAHVYSECARIWNPIHTDIAIARAAGLPGLILHGTATLALAVSRVVATDLDGDPRKVRELAARFTGMVGIPSTLTVRGHARHGDLVSFDTVDERGAPVLSQGILRA
ncbi:MAG: MaoC family dehydratase N-terminal domain-containing protein [Candidatus Rokubacteria bacterium]|nr:MaoC family dehydratase N-terminal domain-containing protein [Candidatus Rokubacteria bacterium]